MESSIFRKFIHLFDQKKKRNTKGRNLITNEKSDEKKEYIVFYQSAEEIFPFNLSSTKRMDFFLL